MKSVTFLSWSSFGFHHFIVALWAFMYILYIYPQQFLLGSLCLTETHDLQFAIKQNSPAKFGHSCAFSAERGFKVLQEQCGLARSNSSIWLVYHDSWNLVACWLTTISSLPWFAVVNLTWLWTALLGNLPCPTKFLSISNCCFLAVGICKSRSFP